MPSHSKTVRQQATAKRRKPAVAAMASSLPAPSLDRQDVGARLRQIRRARKLTLAQLSESSGVALSTLSKMELGQVSISYEKFVAVANALAVEFAQLFADSSAATEHKPTFVLSSMADAPSYRSDHYDHHMLSVEYPSRQMTPCGAG